MELGVSLSLDTNAYRAFRDKVPFVKESIQTAPLIALSTVMYGKVLCGVVCSSRTAENFALLQQFLQTPRVHVLAVDARTAEIYGDIYQVLRDKGTLIPTNDMWIAAHAIQHNLPLLTRDAHFQRVDGLQILSW